MPSWEGLEGAVVCQAVTDTGCVAHIWLSECGWLHMIGYASGLKLSVTTHEPHSLNPKPEQSKV